MSKDYLKYYKLEDYIFEEVRNNFNKRGYLLSEEFFSIIIWKANRAKTKIKKRLLERGNVQKSVKELTGEIYKADNLEEKLNILTKEWGFYLPMATAILTVLYPKEFTIYDIRVREQLNLKETASVKKYFSEFLPMVKDFAKKQNLSLRDADRYLWGKSFHEDIKKLIK